MVHEDEWALKRTTSSGAFFAQNDLAKAFLAITAIVCAVSASYAVWKRERQALCEAQGEISKLKEKKALREAIDSLAELRAFAVTGILNVRGIKNDDEFRSWKEKQENWWKDVCKVLQENFSKADLLAFKTLGSINDCSFLGAYNQEYDREILFLDARLKVLQGILSRNTIETICLSG